MSIPIKNADPIKVTLSIDSKSLDDIVVVGYGTQKKRAVTGAVASVGYEQFKDRSFVNVAQSLAVQLPELTLPLRKERLVMLQL
jgi:hypothetical protein